MAEQQSKHELLKTGANMCKAGAICAGVSLIIGGVLLSSVGLICALVGRSKFSKANKAEYLTADERQQAQKIMNISLAVAIGALVLNAFALYAMWPVIMEVMQTGDISAIYGTVGSGSVSSAATGATSTWG